MRLTDAQEQAVRGRGNVLVVAGAGTGKTSTLVERCLDCLRHETPRVSIDEILMVTFTEAAAAEMRQRIRARLDEELGRHPGDSHWPEQLALFETAHLGTLHSFCLRLVRQHFYELELDPQLTVLAEEEARLLAEETLDALLEKQYAGRSGLAEAVRDLIQVQGRGWDKPVRTLVLRVHDYTQTRPDAGGWVESQLARLALPEPRAWQELLPRAIAEWRASWLPQLEAVAGENPVAATCREAMIPLSEGSGRGAAARALEIVAVADERYPRGMKRKWVDPLKPLFEESRFLLSLARGDGSGGPPGGAGDPLIEDWDWSRPHLSALLQLAREFTASFTAAKRELGVVDYHDLEQYALRLLWDQSSSQPTAVAKHWRRQLRFVFVDEYQDINAAQDKILEALSREDAQGNRFLVGDIKQSIYRFRLADPAIFQGYAEKWRSPPGQAIALVENFRSREGILNFVNSVFGVVMRPEFGGVTYDEQARLRFGAPRERQALSAANLPRPCVELRLRLKSKAEDPNEPDPALDEVRDVDEASREASQVAERLRALKAAGYPVWDADKQQFRPVTWRDMAILLRSPSGKAEAYAKEFLRLNVPLEVARGGFYDSMEVRDLLSLLQVLDNPLQDLPVLALLHSPLVGLTLDELAQIRLAARRSHYWSALTRWHETHRNDARSAGAGEGSAGAAAAAQGSVPESDTQHKVSMFLDRFAHWRRLTRQVSLSRCLETILAETHYADWLLTQPRGETRYANVQRLVSLAERFDQFQRQGLFRFLRFVEAQQLAETEPEVAAVQEEDAVRLMSIHQSKGLEFPVVVLGDLGKPFNLQDLRAEIILDEQLGLCPQVKPPNTGKRYPSLAHWVTARRQLRELLGEEVRLLYVAMTRARDLLLLSGSTSAKRFADYWQSAGPPDLWQLTAARSCADWLGLWFGCTVGPASERGLAGTHSLLRWEFQDAAGEGVFETWPAGAQAGTEVRTKTQAGAPNAGDQPLPAGQSLPCDAEQLRRLAERLAWRYPFAAATRQPAKTSVSVLRRMAAAEAEEAARAFPGPDSGGALRGLRAPSRAVPALAAEIGSAHHTFLQLVSLDRTGSVAELKEEAARLQRRGSLSPEAVARLDLPALASFWGSELGQRIRAAAPLVQRELAFTVRLTPGELAQLTGAGTDPRLADEWVVVQGVADLVVLKPEEIWLLDFKTDRIQRDQQEERVRDYTPQVQLYARALARIYHRPVSEGWLYFLATQTPVLVFQR